MILEFSIENTLSIFSKSILSFEQQEISENTLQIGSKNISKVKCVYGDNGSGKTNLIQAFNFYMDFLLNSFSQLEPNESTHFVPFQFNDNSQKLPGKFSIIFFLDAIRYDYEITLNKEKVLSEVLYFAPNGQKSLLYNREERNIKWGTSFAGAKKLIADTTRDNCSILSVAAQLNNQTLLPIYTSIRKAFKGFVSPEKGGLTGYTLSRIEENSDFKKTVLSMLQEVNNSNISDIIVHSKAIPQEYLDELPQEIRAKLLKKNTVPKNRKAVLIHSYDKEYELPLELESRGTQRLLELATPMYDLTHTHSFLMIDELETSLHPKVQKRFISDFLKNKMSSQILITTHNTDLIDSGLFSDSEICFALKDKFGNTQIHSIADFTGVRKGVSRKHMYETGKFDQIPSKVRK